MSERPILDMCCGSRMFWFVKPGVQHLYSQEYVTALLDRLHAAEKRIAELAQGGMLHEKGC